MTTITSMTTQELRQLVNDIADIFHIGSLARKADVILCNVRNSAAHEFCINPPGTNVIDAAIMLDKDNPVREYILQAAGIDLDGGKPVK